MTRSITRGRAAAALLAVGLPAVLLATGCGAGQIAQTADTVPAVVGANSTPSPGGDNNILLRNVLLSYPGVAGYQEGASAPLELSIVNIGQRPVTLVRVSTSAAASAVMAAGATPVPAPATPTATATASPAGTRTPAATGSPSPAATGSATATPSAAGTPSATGSAAATPGASPSPSPGGQAIRVRVAPAGYTALSPSTGPTIHLVGLTMAVRPGQSVPGVRFEFDDGTVITLDVPVGMPEEPAPRSPMVFNEGPGPAGGHE